MSDNGVQWIFSKLLCEIGDWDLDCDCDDEEGSAAALRNLELLEKPGSHQHPRMWVDKPYTCAFDINNCDVLGDNFQEHRKI